MYTNENNKKNRERNMFNDVYSTEVKVKKKKIMVNLRKRSHQRETIIYYKMIKDTAKYEYRGLRE